MDCRQVRKKLENRRGRAVSRETGRNEKEALERHLQQCTACRRRYGHLFDFQSPQRLKLRPGLKTRLPRENGQPLQPVEFKDIPVRFELHLDGKTEAIKMVEPEVDLPLPENAELRVRTHGAWLLSLVFRFDEARRRYILDIRNRSDEQGRWHSSTAVFGPEPKPQKKVRDSVYFHEFFRRNNLLAWIEMARGKARIRIRHERAAG